MDASGKCLFCFKTCGLGKWALEYHIRMHIKEYPYICKICNKEYARKEELNLHHKRSHGSTQRYCPFCDIWIHREYAHAHHMLKHTKENVYICQKCGKEFGCPRALKWHTQVHSEGRRFECKQCDKVFLNKGSVWEHVKSIHLKLKPWKCRICGKCYARQHRLSTHMRSHTGEKPFKCDICHFQFPIRESLVYHMKTVHASPSERKRKFVKCEICDKVFTTKPVLKKHMFDIHSGKRKRGVCQVCNKSFSSQIAVRAHMQVHTGEKPFKCQQCGKSFASRSRLEAHKKTHIFTEKMFQCGICNKKFQKKGALTLHMTRHDRPGQFPCTICPDRFHRKDVLFTHIRRHIHEEPFLCTGCGNEFRSQSELLYHKRRICTSREKMKI